MFLSLQIGFSFVKAAVALAILERTSGLEPSSETSALKVPYFLGYKTGVFFLPKQSQRI